MGARLIVVNGPPCAGKSSIAERYAAEHPLALRVDVDELRGWLGGWRDDLHGAGLAARALAVAMARTHLRAGHDVVIAQLYGRTDDLAELELTAADAGAAFVEIVLMADVDDTMTRFVARGGDRLDEVLARPGGLDTVRTLHAKVVAVVAARPAATVIDSSWGDVDATYDRVRAEIGRATPSSGRTVEE